MFRCSVLQTEKAVILFVISQYLILSIYQVLRRRRRWRGKRRESANDAVRNVLLWASELHSWVERGEGPRITESG